MSEKDHEIEELKEHGKENTASSHDVTRRQFLNYTLMGVGGFFAAGIVTPMVSFAIDPLLRVDEDQDMVAVGDVDEFGPEPQRVDFILPVQDGWVDYELSQYAWVRVTDDGTVQAFSPECTHLGCAVEWNGSSDHPEHFFCPCHNGLYDINGKNIPGTPPTEPLYQFVSEVVDGVLYLGRPVPQEEL